MPFLALLVNSASAHRALPKQCIIPQLYTSTSFSHGLRLQTRVQNHDFAAYPVEINTHSSISLLIVFHQYLCMTGRGGWVGNPPGPDDVRLNALLCQEKRTRVTLWGFWSSFL